MNISKYQKFMLSFLLIPISMQLSFAQGIETHKHHSSATSSSKNVFLSMMDNMMTKMDAVPVLSLPDYDFMAQMIPHHEGAIDMALYEIQHGKNHEMIRLAKSIVTEQTSDIQMMKLLLNRLPNKNKSVNKEFDCLMVKSMTTMMENMPTNDQLNSIDVAFAKVMIPHHQAAIDMAIGLLRYSTNTQVSTFAKQLISAEQIEIEQMTLFIK